MAELKHEELSLQKLSWCLSLDTKAASISHVPGQSWTLMEDIQNMRLFLSNGEGSYFQCPKSNWSLTGLP